MTTRQARHFVRIALACAVAVTAVAAAGCRSDDDGDSGGEQSQAADMAPGSVTKDTDKEKTYSVGGSPETVDIDTKGGRIEVVAGEPGSERVQVRESYQYDEERPETEHRMAGSTLRLIAKGCDGWNSCTVNYEVTVPPNTALQLDTSGGVVDVRGTAGSVRASSSGGNMSIKDSKASKVDVSTSGGTITGTFARSPRQVDFSTSGGNIDLRLPGGPYAVEASTDGGVRTVDVPESGTAKRSVSVHSSGGNVTVRPTD